MGPRICPDDKLVVALALLLGLTALLIPLFPSPQPLSPALGRGAEASPLPQRGRGAGGEGAPAERHITVEASSFAYQPARLQVNQGDRVVLEFTSADVMHGLYLDGYGLNLTAEPGHSARAEFVATQNGTFRFRCSITCGPLHPFMIGQLSVSPDRPFWWAGTLAAIAAIGALAFRRPASQKSRASPDQARLPARFELTCFPWLRRLLRSRWPQWGLTAALLAFFLLAILTGLLGTPVGNRNFAIVFVWIVWWALLIVILVPFAGRLWCSICPIPAPGEWLQRRALVTVRRGKLWTLGRRWPRRLRNIWLQNASFLLLALFSARILTQPGVTAWVLLGFLLVAVGLSLVYERRVFCRYLCPVGGFIGLYSTVAPIELRVRDPQLCATHTEKACYIGNEYGYGCPWLAFPGGLTRNTTCGLCTECLKTCTLDNVAINLRPFGADLLEHREGRSDEAFKGLIMLTCALVYSAVLLGPWGELKAAANAVGTPAWLTYVAGFLALNLFLVPALFLGTAALGQICSAHFSTPAINRLNLRRAFVNYAYVLVPLGLAAWIAFSLGFVLINGSYALAALGDPFGWGWNLLGLAHVPWMPLVPGFVPALQALILIGGLVAAVSLAVWVACEQGERQGMTPEAWLAALPVSTFCLAATLVLLWLYMG